MPEFDLMRWYADTDLAWADRTIGDDAPTFWRARWSEEHGTTKQGGRFRPPGPPVISDFTWTEADQTAYAAAKAAESSAAKVKKHG